jgi:hypothetical protein
MAHYSMEIDKMEEIKLFLAYLSFLCSIPSGDFFRAV